MQKSQPLALPDWPGILVYADHEQPTRFYAFPERPRLARDASGQPLLSLLLFGRKTGGRFELSGGQCTVTVDLALSAAERKGLESQLRGQVLSPDWLEGTASLQLLPDLALKGRPSMMGANECTLMATLTAAQAAQLRASWTSGRAVASVAYQVSARVVDALVAERRSGAVAVSASVTAARPLALTLEGPLVLGPDELTRTLQTVGF